MNLDLADFATRTGTDEETIRRMMHLGILPEGDTVDTDHIPRALLAVEIERSGMDLGDVIRAFRDHEISLDFVDRAFIQSGGLRPVSHREYAEAVGLSDAMFEAFRVALGIADSGLDAQIPDLDARLMDETAAFLALGVEENAAARLFQLMADFMRRTVKAVAEMWTAGVQQPLLDQGMSHLEMFREQSVDSADYAFVGERFVTLLWRRYLDEQIYLGTAATLEQALAEAGVVPHSEALPPAIVFLDLTAFTHVTDRDGDEAAASGATTLTRVVRRVVVASGGSMVKMLGDGAMLHFDDPAAAVRACMRLRTEIRDAGLPTARFGVNAGPLMVRDVDYYGHTVNVAARLLDYARPNEILVTNHVVECVEADDVSFTQVGEVSLKGVGGLVDVWMATPD